MGALDDVVGIDRQWLYGIWSEERMKREECDTARAAFFHGSLSWHSRREDPYAFVFED